MKRYSMKDLMGIEDEILNHSFDANPDTYADLNKAYEEIYKRLGPTLSLSPSISVSTSPSCSVSPSASISPSSSPSPSAAPEEEKRPRKNVLKDLLTDLL